MKSLMKSVLVASLLFLASCAGIPETPAQKVFAATSTYNVALTIAVTYKELPECGQPASPVLCSDKGVVTTIQKADIVAFDALSGAQTVVRNQKATASALQIAVAWAQEAVAVFSKLTNTLKVK